MLKRRRIADGSVIVAKGYDLRQPSNDTIIFLGPSLPTRLAKEVGLNADFRSPAGRGDIYRCLGSGIRRIILIDGVFHATPSVWQREILAALDEGIEVLGASSMGALRAFELLPYGMIGSGTIFSWYRDGTIDGDDEVAVVHGDADAEWRCLSTPLVNLRATLLRAMREGALTVIDTQELLAEAKATFYPSRSIRRLTSGEWAKRHSRAEVEKIAQTLNDLYVDLKGQDAIELLRRCATADPVPRDSASKSRDAAVGERVRTRLLATGETGELRLKRAEADGTATKLMNGLAVRWYARQWAERRGIACPADFKTRFERHPAGAVELEKWLAERSVTRREYALAVERNALDEWLSSQDNLLSPDPGDYAGRLITMARQWLSEWGIEVGEELPPPVEFGFKWERDNELLIELLLSEGYR